MNSAKQRWERFLEKKKEDREYLEQVKYDWSKDPRKLKFIDEKGVSTIPNKRCFHCGRLIANCPNFIAYCSMCEMAMSACPDGADHDYDSFHNTDKLIADRKMRFPIEFGAEKQYFETEKDDFKLGNGRPLE